MCPPLIKNPDTSPNAVNFIFRDGFALTRYRPDGSRDTSFGRDGRAVTNLGLFDFNFPNALIVQPDGKLVAAGGSTLVIARYKRNGSLDTRFGAGGLVRRNDIRGATALVVQPDGKLVAAGDFGLINGFLIRFNPDGRVDSTFGSGGRAVADSSVEALVIETDDKLLTAGTRSVFTNGVLSEANFALQRFNPDGSPDTSFGSGGLVITDFGEDSRARALVVQPDGKLVVAGTFGPFGTVNRDFALARYQSDGSVDTSFGSGGFVITDLGEDSEAAALVLQADGKLVMAGTLGPLGSFNRDFALERYHLDGSVDMSFGTGGLVRTAFVRSFSERVPALVLQADGNLVGAGGSSRSGDPDFAVVRYVTTDAPLAVPRQCGGRPATILGTSRNDTIRGTRGADVILGLGGNDTIRGLKGADTICGGAGRDMLIGNEGKDRLLGEDGDDKLFGDSGRDKLDGGSGRDACRTGETARRCEGRPASSRPTSGERPKDPPRAPCPPVASFPCS